MADQVKQREREQRRKPKLKGGEEEVENKRRERE